MKRFMDVMSQAWRMDILERRPFATSGNFWLYLAALLLPFGWVFLLLQLEPVRLLVRSRRD